MEIVARWLDSECEIVLSVEAEWSSVVEVAQVGLCWAVVTSRQLYVVDN